MERITGTNPIPRGGLQFVLNYIWQVLALTAMAFPSWTAMAEDGQNPHWRTDACDTCHIEKSPTAGNPLLNAAPDDALCLDCHAATSESACRHLSTIPADPDMQRRMPGSFQASLRDDQVVCETCHELPAQCLDERRNERFTNPMFLREGPFHQRSDPCYLCHDKNAYTKLNPHDQFADSGDLREAICLLCHTSVDATGKITGNNLSFSTGDDLSAMCTGCHPVEPHPGATFSFSGTDSSNHLVIPSPEVRRRMDETAASTGIRLPVDPLSGKIFCATCHDPHDDNLPDYPVTPADTRDTNRLRQKNICLACHDK